MPGARFNISTASSNRSMFYIRPGSHSGLFQRLCSHRRGGSGPPGHLGATRPRLSSLISASLIPPPAAPMGMCCGSHLHTASAAAVHEGEPGVRREGRQQRDEPSHFYVLGQQLCRSGQRFTAAQRRRSAALSG